MQGIKDLIAYVEEISVNGIGEIIEPFSSKLMKLLEVDSLSVDVNVDGETYSVSIGEAGNLKYKLKSSFKDIDVTVRLPKRVNKKRELLDLFAFVIYSGYKFHLDFLVKKTVLLFLEFLKTNINTDNFDFFEKLVSFMIENLEVGEVSIIINYFDSKKVFALQQSKRYGDYNYSFNYLDVTLDIRYASSKIKSLEVFFESLLLYINLYLYKILVSNRLNYFSFFYNISNLFRRTVDLRKRVEIALWALCCEKSVFGFKEAMYFIYDQDMDVFKGFLSFRGFSCEKMLGAVPLDSDLYDVIEGISIHVDVKDDEVVPLLKSLKDALGISSHYAYLIPLFVENRLIGAFVVGSNYEANQMVIEMLNHFADQCSLAFESAKVQELYRKTVEELRLAQESLLEAERLKNLGEFVARIVHDIKNPLVAMVGLAEKLYRKFPEDYPEKKVIKMIVEEGNKLLDSLQDILSYVRKPAIKKESVDINALIDEVLFMEVYELRDKKIVLVKELNRRLPLVKVDKSQIKRVLINIVKNAIQAMERLGGGVLRVATDGDTIDNKSYIRIEISDTGGGIPPEVLPNIFNPFFTTKSEGTGLGLSTSKKIVEAHGGFIKLINDYPKGATFQIYLPIEEG